VIYGIGLAILVRVRPQGLLPEGVSLLPARAAERLAPPSVRDAAATNAVDIGSSRPSQLRPPTGAGPILEVRGLNKQFGGIVACRDLSLDLETGKIAALVGPNGAGKTTVFNLLTGAFGADSGSIKLNGEELRGLGPDAVARKGMARTFQDVRLFARMSALENVMLAMRGIEGRSGGEKLSDLFLHPRRAARAERSERDGAMEHLRLVGLADVAGTAAGALSYGQQKLVSFARLMATDADVLLLDEPASGVDARWVDKLLELVVYARDRGKTICIVEHSLHVVERLADTVFFMELGHITAKGTIRELTSDPRLAEVYFGTV
jgi:branched-chain amino acid transport system permease protein